MIAWLFCLVSVGLFPLARADSLPTFGEVKAAYSISEGQLLDRKGRLLQEMRLDWSARIYPWVPLERVAPSLIYAILDLEDKKFEDHGGVDAMAVAAAVWQNLVHGTRRGASTISMQTVSLVEDAGKLRKGRRSLWAKLRQARLALELEKKWTKREILEAYLNLVGFRGELRGLAAAARTLFGKDPHGLDFRESYLLGVLLRSPGMGAKSASERLCRLAAVRKELGSCTEIEAFVLSSLSHWNGRALRVSHAPHLARRLLSAERKELRSTIDMRVQMHAAKAVRDQLLNLNQQNVGDAAVIVVDNRSGQILAYIGGAGGFSKSPEVDMAVAFRQAGSSLKPFLYALAFEKGYLHADSWLLDEPFEVGLDRGSYEPENYDHQFHGPVSAKVALASSLNIPAVRVLDLVGAEEFRDFLSRLGFQGLAGGEHYGHSLALGTADIRLIDLVQAYLVLANQGKWRSIRFEMDEQGRDTPRILSRKVADQISAILSDRGFRALTFGWDSLLATSYPSAVKTGTSKDMRDNWCVGYSTDYTVGVWVGNGSGDPMWAVSGVSGAAPIWRSVMDFLHKGRKARALPVLVRSEAILEPNRFGKILYPAQGAIIAIDPDIPKENQKLLLEKEGEGMLSLDDQGLSEDLWSPSTGRHHLRLLSSSGTILDEVYFEVR